MQVSNESPIIYFMLVYLIHAEGLTYFSARVIHSWEIRGFLQIQEQSQIYHEGDIITHESIYNLRCFLIYKYDDYHICASNKYVHCN